MEIGYRPMVLEDIEQVPLDCHGDTDTLISRISDLGAAAILGFEGDQHVAQLQFRRHDPGLHSPKGIWSPDYWGDFGDLRPPLPEETLGVFCYHVGQLSAGEDRDSKYFGRGIGLALLDYFIGWAEEQAFEAIVAKCVPADRSVMAFMGGQPLEAYEARGFELESNWVDNQLYQTVREKELVPENSDPEAVARVGMCVKRF